MDEPWINVVSDAMSLNGFEAASVSSFTSFRDATFEEISTNVLSLPSSELQLKEQNVVETAGRNSVHNVNSQENNTSKHFERHDEASTVYADEIVASDGRLLDPCGILPNNCLPCLVPVEKKGSISSSPPGSRKKATLRLSFKWRSGEGHTPNTLREFFNCLFP